MRKGLRGISAIAVAGLTALCMAAPAGAAETHVFKGSFKTAPNSNPGLMAVDDTTGDIYVLGAIGAGQGNVYRFDSAGNPKDFPLLGSNVIDGAGGADENGEEDLVGKQVAVDNSNGLNKGTIYVANPGGFFGANDVQAFLPSGKYAGSLFRTSDEMAEENPAGGGEFCGVSVSADGSVFSSKSATWFFPRFSFVDKFKPGLWVPDSVPPQNFGVRSTLHELEENSCKIAADSKGNVYADTSALVGTKTLRRYSASLFNTEGPAGKVIDTKANGSAVDQSNDDVYVNRGNEIARYDSSGALLETFGAGLFGFQAGGVAVNAADGTVYASDLLAGEVEVFEQVTTPDITAISATTTAVSATVSATIGDAGAGAVTGCKVVYGTSEAYGQEAACVPNSFGASTPITATIAGLATEQTYHYRVEATNANGTTRSANRTFTTHAVADLVAEKPSQVTQSSATLHGSFTGAGKATTYQFEWGTDTTYGQTTEPDGPNSGSGKQQLEAEIEGLEVYTAYHFRIKATNSDGTTYSPDFEFLSAPPFMPTVSGTNAGGVTPTGATIGAQVNPGRGATVFLVEYGQTSGFGQQTSTSDSIGDEDAEIPVSANLTGLTPGTTYHYRVVAMNFSGTTEGPTLTFNTPAAPSVTPLAATAITQTSATLAALVAPGFQPTGYRFEYGTSPAYGSTAGAGGLSGADNSGAAVSAAIGGLEPGTTYHFRVVASNAIGETAGADGTFTTQAAPQVVGPPPGKGPKACPKGKVKKKGKCVKKKPKKKKKKKSGKRRSS